MGIMRLGYLHVRVTDLEEARDHYSNTMGMQVVHEEPGKLYLKCWDEWDHHSLVLEEGGVGLVKIGYKCSSDEDLAKYEKRSAQFGATTGRFSRGENLTVGEGVRITLPSEHTVELYTEMEFTGTDTGSINPDPWPRHVRGVGTHWIDHCLIAAEDPGLIERFFQGGLGLPDRRAGDREHGEPGADRRVVDRPGIPRRARPRRHQGPELQAAPLRLPSGRLVCDPACRGHLLDGRRAHRHRARRPSRRCRRHAGSRPVVQMVGEVVQLGVRALDHGEVAAWDSRPVSHAPITSGFSMLSITRSATRKSKDLCQEPLHESRILRGDQAMIDPVGADPPHVPRPRLGVDRPGFRSGELHLGVQLDRLLGGQSDAHAFADVQVFPGAEPSRRRPELGLASRTRQVVVVGHL